MSDDDEGPCAAFTRPEDDLVSDEPTPEQAASTVVRMLAERETLRVVVAGCLRCSQRMAITPESLGVAPMPPHYHDDALLTLRLAAEVLTVSYSTITKWTARGEFCPQAFKLPNGEYRVRYRDLVRWALSMRGVEA